MLIDDHFIFKKEFDAQQSENLDSPFVFDVAEVADVSLNFLEVKFFDAKELTVVCISVEAVPVAFSCYSCVVLVAVSEISTVEDEEG